jgi:ankyrin repeat protein
MSLRALPTELVNAVAQNLLHSLNDLNALTQVCRRLHVIANPTLYRHHIDHQQGTALLWAAEHGKDAACNRLLREGADANIQDPENRTPLSRAAQNGHESVVSTLLSTGKADPNASDMLLHAPLHWAAGIGRNFFASIFDTQLGAQDLSPAAMGKYRQVVRLLLSANGIQAECRTSSGETPLTIAADAGAEAVVEEFLCSGKVDPDSRDDYGQSPLMAAARSGSLGVVKQLLAAEGVDPNPRSNSGDSPFFIAARAGHAEVVKLLLSLPNVDPNQRDHLGHTALLGAVGEDNTEVARQLLATEGIDISTNTPLLTATHRGCTETMGLLLAKGADPDRKDNDGDTPLMIAAGHGHVKAFELLVSTGRVQTDFDLSDRKSSFKGTRTTLDPSMVKILDDYKRRGQKNTLSG